MSRAAARLCPAVSSTRWQLPPSHSASPPWRSRLAAHARICAARADRAGPRATPRARRPPPRAPPGRAVPRARRRGPPPATPRSPGRPGQADSDEPGAFQGPSADCACCGSGGNPAPVPARYRQAAGAVSTARGYPVAVQQRGEQQQRPGAAAGQQFLGVVRRQHPGDRGRGRLAPGRRPQPLPAAGRSSAGSHGSRCPSRPSPRRPGRARPARRPGAPPGHRPRCAGPGRWSAGSNRYAIASRGLKAGTGTATACCRPATASGVRGSDQQPPGRTARQQAVQVRRVAQVVQDHQPPPGRAGQPASEPGRRRLGVAAVIQAQPRGGLRVPGQDRRPARRVHPGQQLDPARLPAGLPPGRPRAGSSRTTAASRPACPALSSPGTSATTAPGTSRASMPGTLSVRTVNASASGGTAPARTGQAMPCAGISAGRLALRPRPRVQPSAEPVRRACRRRYRRYGP